MYEKDNSQIVYKPKNLIELLTLADTNPTALIYAGGIEFILKKNTDQDIFYDYQYISLGEIEELSRISRTERYLEIGAATTIAKILNIGKNIISTVLFDALIATGNPALRNIITIGGNICSSSANSTILPVLYLLDAKVEVRNINKARWMPVSRFVTGTGTGPGKNILEPGEILSRVRIPSGDWQLQSYKKLAPRKTHRQATLVFCALAGVTKNVLTDLRLVYGAVSRKILRSRDMEMILVGSKLPLNEKEVNALSLLLHDLLTKDTGSHPSLEYKRETSIRLTHWFLDELNNY